MEKGASCNAGKGLDTTVLFASTVHNPYSKRHGLRTVLTKIAIGIAFSIALLGSANIAYADYTIDQSATTSAQGGGTQGGASFTTSKYGFYYNPTTTATYVDRVELKICATPSLTGTLVMNVYSGTIGTYLQPVSTSTLNASGNVALCGSGSVQTGTSTTFVLNPPVSWTAGTSFFFTITGVGLNTSANIYEGSYTPGNGWELFSQSTSTDWTRVTSQSLSGDYIYGAKILAFGSRPNINIGGYNQQTTNECGYTTVLGIPIPDIGCYFANGLAWAFYPDEDTLDQFEAINLASSSPFGYVYSMDDAYQTFMTALNATTSSFKITLDMTTLKNTASVFNGVSTSSITVFDICWVNRSVGELPADSFKNTFLPIVVFMMWIGLGWLFYSTAHRIW